MCLFIFSNMMLLSGCWDRTEINDLAIILGVGIDRKKDGKIEITVQFPSPKIMSVGSQGSETNESLIRSGEGEDLALAISDLQKKLPRKVFWGQTKVIILGKRLAEEDIRGKMDLLLRHPQPRMLTYVFVSDRTAKSTLMLIPPLERYSSEVLREMAISNILMNVTLRDAVLMLRGSAGAAALPLIHILPPEQEKEKLKTIAYINGTALFKKGKMIGTLNTKLSRGVLWVKNEIKDPVITVKPKDAKGNISAIMYRLHTKLVPKIKDNKWLMTIKISGNVDIIDNESQFDVTKPEISREIEIEMEKAIEKRIQLTLLELQKNMKADIVGFSELFHQHYPKEWKKVKGRWEEVFTMVEVSYQTKVRMRPGMSKPPVLPENEVEPK